MTEPIKILMVEDNPGDVELTRIHLQDAKVLHELAVCSTGEEALSYLRHQPPHEAGFIPDLILLDLNLPGMSGHEILQQLKTDEALQKIPVVVLTSSAAETDIAQSYKHHANAYVTKPVDLAKFGDIVRSIENFWLGVVKLPPR